MKKVKHSQVMLLSFILRDLRRIYIPTDSDAIANAIFHSLGRDLNVMELLFEFPEMTADNFWDILYWHFFGTYLHTLIIIAVNKEILYMQP